METSKYIPPTELMAETKKFDTERVVTFIDAILEGQHNYLDDTSVANYDAEFPADSEPYFLNIWNREKGNGLGYVVFHDFLIQVGLNQTFSSTDFTNDGQKLFAKAVADGLISQIAEPTGLARVSRWQVVGDPKANLEKIKIKLQA